MEEKNKRQQIIIRICCVIASAILWLYIFNVENPMRERKITVPVQITNKEAAAQSKLVPVGEGELNATITIRGNASDIYMVKSSDFKLESDLSAYVLKKGENKIPVLVKKSPESVKIINNESLWVTVELDDLKQKTTSIRVILDGKAKEGFYAMQPVIKNTEVQISGSSELVSTVKGAVARCNVANASKDIIATKALQPVDASGNVVKDVTISPNSIEVTVPVKKVKSVPIKVKTQGELSSSSNIKSIVPVTETVDIAGDENVISGITVLNTEPVDVSKFYGKDTLEVKLDVPKNVTLINSDGNIKLKADFDKTAQKELDLSIQTKNLGSNYSVSLEVEKVNIKVSGPESSVNNLKAEDIQCYVDLASLAEGEHYVNVITSESSGIYKIVANPSTIKVIIKSKIAEDKNVSQGK